MNEREKTIRLWFDMWLNQQDMGIDDIFTEDVIYTESWSPQYNNRKTVKHWFQEWNTRGKVVIWEVKQFFHKGDQTIVEWYFKNEMNNGSIRSLLEHTTPAASLYFLYWRTAKWFGFSASNASNIRSTGFLNSSSSSRTSIALMNSIRVEKFCSSTGAS